MNILRPTPRLRYFSHAIRIIVAILLFSAIPAIAGDPIEIEDANLKSSIREALQIENDPLTAADLEQLTALNLMGRKIESLAGLEFASNLQHLNLRGNRITDLSPLAALEKLEVLGLRDNPVADISPLAEMLRLRELDLRNNRVEDISPLSQLVELRILGLRDNRVADISPLAANVRLQHLDLRNNRRISDISPLANLHELEWLSLRDCTISEIQSLSELHRLRYIDIHHNRVADISQLNDLPELKWLDLRRNHLRFSEDAHALATLLLLKRRAETIYYSPQKRMSHLETTPEDPGEAEAAAESLVHPVSLEESGSPPAVLETSVASPSITVSESTTDQSATDRLPKESILFAAEVELTLIFDDNAEEFTLRSTSEENTVEIKRSDSNGEFTYTTYPFDQPTEFQLRLILGQDDEKGYLLQLNYETADTGLFEGSLNFATDSSQPRSGTFRWH